MPKPIAFLIFLIIEIVLLPVTIVGGIIFAVDFIAKWRVARTLMTAYDPLFARWLLNAQGKRTDAACKRLLAALPGGSPTIINLMCGPTVLAMRLTGFTVNMYDYPVYSSSNLIDTLGHRTRFFDDAMLGYLDKVSQVVILGAGWDTRAYGLARREGVRVFEVDTVKTQTQKRKSLEKANIDTAGITFATADFNTETWLDALNRVGFDPNKPTFVLMEGVTYYLETKAVEATLRIVATELAKDSTIAFEYPAEHIFKDDAPLFHRLVGWGTQLVGEPWIFGGISTKPPAKEQLAVFLERNGLTLANFEPIGKQGKRLHGGLALAVNE